MIEVQLTNFAIPQIATLNKENHKEELHPDLLPQSIISALDGRIKIIPHAEKKIRDIVNGRTKKALNTVSAIAQVEDDIHTCFSSQFGNSINFDMLIFCLCDLLCLATRRGVSFKPSRKWCVGNGKPIIRGSTEHNRGIIQTNTEMANLITRGLPKMLSPDFDTNGKSVVTALRWFLNWEAGQGIDLKFIRLWIVIEMLAYNYLKNDPNIPKYNFDRVTKYLQAQSLPNIAEIPLRAMYDARNKLVHGNPEEAEKKMCKWFGDYVEKRRKHFSESARQELFGQIDEENLPDPTNYGCCMYEAVHMLSRLLEKVFLNLMDCTDTFYYQNSPYFTTWSP